MTSPDLAALVTGFFVRYLAAERNVSPHTTAAYRDTLKLLLRFASDVAHRPVTTLRFEDLTPDLIRRFLDHLETVRHNTVRTRNARLAAIHSFIRYVLDREPGLATTCQRILSIPVKKTTRPVLGYLTDTELAHLLAQVDRATPAGERDYLLLALLYDTAVRIQELLDLTPSDFRLASPLYVRIQGKGKQERWFRTVRTQLLPTLTDADTRDLEALNRRLWAWIEDEYHYAPHRGLAGATPIDRWAATSAQIQLPTSDLSDIFLFEEKRKVQQDRTVSLHGVVYEVDAALVGETVTLRYDPARAIRGVQVLYPGRPVATAKPVDAYANCFVRRDHGTKLLTPHTPASHPPPGLPLRKLDEDF